jgi:hypothetical protein
MTVRAIARDNPEHFPAKPNPVCRKKMLYFNDLRVF